MSMMAEPEPKSAQSAFAKIADYLDEIIPRYGEQSRRSSYDEGERRFPAVIQIDGTAVPTADIAREISHFLNQIEALESHGIAMMQDDGLDIHEAVSRTIGVLVKVPDLRDPARSYEPFLRNLSDAGTRLAFFGRSTARKTFIRGLAEFLLTRANVGSSVVPPVTIVDSNRRGDTLFFALGFYLSTGTAFGTSRATIALPSGRYSFGIGDTTGVRFENHVWSIPNPNVVMVKLP